MELEVTAKRERKKLVEEETGKPERKRLKVKVKMKRI